VPARVIEKESAGGYRYFSGGKAYLKNNIERNGGEARDEQRDRQSGAAYDFYEHHVAAQAKHSAGAKETVSTLDKSKAGDDWSRESQ
jgi:hypothetical protein